MTAEIRDPEFARFIDELSNALSIGASSFALRVLLSITMSAVAAYDALATPEPGLVDRASRGFAL